MTVFANGLEVACKAQANKVIAAFPDVCFTPPENPATPPGVPVPYPSFGMDSDTDKGTSTVKIGGKTITHKNKSYYTKTTGTEAGCAAKKGVVTSKNTGKEYAVAWSGNVKADGEPVSRFSDLSTNNHASPPGNAPPWPKAGQAAAPAPPAPSANEQKRQECAKIRQSVFRKYQMLGKELRKYDPVSDARGGFVMKGGKITKPGGHYKEMRDLQKGMKNDMTDFQKKGCSETGLKIDKSVDQAANREIPVPPGIQRIPLS